MYWQLLTQRLHRPAFLMGIVMAMLASLLNPSTMTYVAYSAFRMAGFQLRMAVFITNISIFGSYALGACCGSCCCSASNGQLSKLSP